MQLANTLVKCGQHRCGTLYEAYECLVQHTNELGLWNFRWALVLESRKPR